MASEIKIVLDEKAVRALIRGGQVKVKGVYADVCIIMQDIGFDNIISLCDEALMDSVTNGPMDFNRESIEVDGK